jgi:hypothetical protein
MGAIALNAGTQLGPRARQGRASISRREQPVSSSLNSLSRPDKKHCTTVCPVRRGQSGDGAPATADAWRPRCILSCKKRGYPFNTARQIALGRLQHQILSVERISACRTTAGLQKRHLFSGPLTISCCHVPTLGSIDHARTCYWNFTLILILREIDYNEKYSCQYFNLPILANSSSS